MRHEESSIKQHLLPFPPHVLRTQQEATQELLSPCGRFKSPFTFKEKLLLSAASSLPLGNSLLGGNLNLSSGIPLNWQFLLQYLHKRGIAREPIFTFEETYNDYPKIYKLMLGARYDDSSDGRRNHVYGFATTPNIEEGMSKAVGEMLERYVLTMYKQKSFIRSSMKDLAWRTRSLDITTLNGFLPWQVERFPQLKRGEDSPFHWIKAEQLGTGPAYIPAQLVFWNYDFNKDVEEPILLNPTTNGAGAHFTREEATLSGLFEIIHRDGFLIYWLNSLSPRVLDVSRFRNAKVQELLASFKRYGLDLRFLNITTDIGIPSIAAVVVDERGKEPLIAVGGAAGFDAAEMILHSASEALSISGYVRGLSPYILADDYAPFVNNKIGRVQRLTSWRGKQMRERFDFLVSGEVESIEEYTNKIPHLKTPKEKLDYVLHCLRALGKGYELYIYDAKHPMLDALGYYVVKVIIPQLMHLYLVEDRPTLDARRLREVPEKLGYRAAKEFNPWPHPFP